MRSSKKYTIHKQVSRSTQVNRMRASMCNPIRFLAKRVRQMAFVLPQDSASPGYMQLSDAPESNGIEQRWTLDTLKAKCSAMCDILSVVGREVLICASTSTKSSLRVPALSTVPLKVPIVYCMYREPAQVPLWHLCTGMPLPESTSLIVRLETWSDCADETSSRKAGRIRMQGPRWKSTNQWRAKPVTAAFESRWTAWTEDWMHWRIEMHPNHSKNCTQVNSTARFDAFRQEWCVAPNDGDLLVPLFLSPLKILRTRNLRVRCVWQLLMSFGTSPLCRVRFPVLVFHSCHGGTCTTAQPIFVEDAVFISFSLQAIPVSYTILTTAYEGTAPILSSSN
jgi:hypothetical protein